MNDLFGFNQTEDIQPDFTSANQGTYTQPYQPYQEEIQQNFQEQADPFANISSEQNESSSIKAALEEAIQQRLRTKMDEEWKMKQERKLLAQQYIQDAYRKRNAATQQRKMQNFEEEKQEKAIKAKAKSDLNVWELTCKCVELQEQNYPGSKDVSIIRRMILYKKNEKRS